MTMTTATVETPVYPQLDGFRFSADCAVKCFDSEQEAHDELLAVYFAAVREREERSGKRVSDAASMKEFQSLWKIWRMFVKRENEGQDLPVMA